MAAEFKIVIPARYASSRLPGKPLLEILGRPMLLHVIDRARESRAAEILVATDDERIYRLAESAGVMALMTNASHSSGSERLAEVVERLGWADDGILVNLQGDEPAMPAELIDQVAADMVAFPDAVMTTLGSRIQDPDELFNPNVVKLVTDAQGYALYFSRAPIPWLRDAFAAGRPEHLSGHPSGITTPFLRHIGLYAYRAGFLRRYLAWPPSPLEVAESLEQLRVLWHGERIHVSQCLVRPGPGVDTQADLDAASLALQQRSGS